MEKDELLLEDLEILLKVVEFGLQIHYEQIEEENVLEKEEFEQNIETGDVLVNFIRKLSKMQCGLQKEKFSISLYYNNERLNWVWLDDTKLTLNKTHLVYFV
ncbi:hypothetical protein JEQ12_014952 [Ovis aries]|uniref:Uncharacterized protein n=1 Tax=Ovis aries TaxID=9940 RepID=A0A836AL64_SHEEP|nr:hypothetical protein JEQ12_014952 [Ovis aries]